MEISFSKKTALVHDWYSSKFSGGAENTVKIMNQVLYELFDEEPSLYALIKDFKNNSDRWPFAKKINTSFIQNLPFSKSYLQNYLPLFPLAIEQFDLSSYDLIISSSHVAAKGVLTSPNQLHISYIHTPMRYAWDQMHTYLAATKFKKFGLEPLIRIILHYLRSWDQTSSTRIDKLIANSNFTAKRIKKYWGRDSKVIFPPVDTDRFDYQKERSDYYISVCRLVPNKRVDLIIRAFNYLKLPLLVIGDGPEKNKLRKLACENVQILGFQEEIDLKKYLEASKAFVYAGIEDFGIAPVEAMAAGSPVIAYDSAGLKDTVNCISSNSKFPTGILFKEQSVRCLIETIEWYEAKRIWESIHSYDLRSWANKFSLNNFKKNFTNYIDECCNDFF